MLRWLTERVAVAGWHPFVPTELPADGYLLDVRNLRDGKRNSDAELISIIDRGAMALASGKRLIVRCDVGVSRSNAIAAAILGRAENRDFWDAAWRVSRANKDSEISLSLLSEIQGALNAQNKTGARTEIIVTGGSGTIGKALARSAEFDDAVFIATEDCDLAREPIRFRYLLEKHRAGTVIHLAAPRVKSSNASLGIALTMLANVIDVCRSADAKLVFLSHAEVFAGYSGTIFADESVQRRPVDHAGLTAHLSEELIQSAVQQKGLRAVLVRLPKVYDPVDAKPRFIFNFIECALRKAPIQYHQFVNGTAKVELIHSNVIAARLRRMLETAADGACFHLPGTHNVTTIDIVRSIEKGIGRSIDVETIEIPERLSNAFLVTAQVLKESGIDCNVLHEIESDTRRMMSES